jgi:hypothetical protein
MFCGGFSKKDVCFLNMYLRTATPVGQKDGSFSSSLNLNGAPTLKHGKVLFVVGIFSQLNLVFGISFCRYWRTISSVVFGDVLEIKSHTFLSAP